MVCGKLVLPPTGVQNCGVEVGRQADRNPEDSAM